MVIKTIAVDFDGTLCFSKWPELGTPNMPLIQRLIVLRNSGVCKLILWTCREGELLDNAVCWCAQQGLTFDAINENLAETKAYWRNDSRKISYDLLIDDKSYHPHCANCLELLEQAFCHE